MPEGLVAEAGIVVDVPASKVWHALVDPAVIKQWFFGTTLTTDWKKGSPITWAGEWQGKKYEDTGVVLDIQPGRMMRYSHFSPLAGKPDVPENYHTVTVEVGGHGDHTHVTLTQDNNADEEGREHSAKNWAMVLGNLKKLLETAA